MAPHSLIKAIGAQSPDLTMISATSWIPLFKSESWLRQRHLEEKLSTKQIAALASAARSTIAKYLRMFSIPRRSEDEARQLRKGQTGYGKKLVHGKEVDHQREAETIRRIKELRAQGLRCHRIADILNTIKIPTKTRGAMARHASDEPCKE
jgi:hypothetical protein